MKKRSLKNTQQIQCNSVRILPRTRTFRAITLILADFEVAVRGAYNEKQFQSTTKNSEMLPKVFDDLNL